MFAPCQPPSRLSWLQLLLAFSNMIAVATCSPSPSPGTLEVDLIFPKNDTYDPGSLIFPVIFAIQNPQLAAPLDVRISYSISPIRHNGSAITNLLSPGRTNISRGVDPYYNWDRTPEMHDVEGLWLLQWDVTVNNCSTVDGRNASAVGSTYADRYNLLWFTTKKGAQQPDFVAATSEDVCESTGSFTYNVTGVVRNHDVSPIFPLQSECAVLSEERLHAAANPCAVKIDNATAANLSAELDASRCGIGFAIGHCEPSKPDSRGAVQQIDGILALLTAIGICTFTILV